MKKLYKVIVFSLVSFLAYTNAHATQMNSELLFTAKLTGDQEVPAVTTKAKGLASFSVNEDMDSVHINMVVNGLSGDITGIHIHKGRVGANGGVVVNLGSMVNGTQIAGSLDSKVVTKTFLAELIAGMYYINVHTKDNPAGEIRGQLMLETDWLFTASLDTAQQGHSVSTNAVGTAVFNVSQNGKTLWYNVVTNDLSDTITAAHLHNGKAGVSGGVALNLAAGINGKMIKGSVDISSNTDLVKNMLDGAVYINIHTAANPMGEIRGQLEVKQGITFDSRLTTDQETTPVTGSKAIGNAWITFNSTMDTMWYTVLAADLSGAITGAHIHSGKTGASGSVLVNLSSSINGNWISGFASGSSLNKSLLSAMLNGETYINLHTVLNPAGETRGQIYAMAREGYTFNLSGMNEVPSVLTNGIGVATVSIDRTQSNAHYMIVVDQLSGKITGAHFHQAKIDANGGVIFNFTPSLELQNNYDAAFGYWDSSSTMAFTKTNAMQFQNEEVYINIHTAAYASGEIRGQADRGLAKIGLEWINNGMLPQAPNFQGQLLYTARLNGAAQVPMADTRASGVIGILVSPDYSSIRLKATFDSLSSNLTGVHIHEGAEGSNGPVVVNLSDSVSGNQINAQLDTLDLAKLSMGMYYINIHSEKYPGGELRGQLKLETETSFVSNIDPTQEVHPVVSSGIGLGHFYLTNNNKELRFKVVFDALTSNVTGVHLHSAKAGANGSVVADLSAMVSGNVLIGTVDPSAFISDLMAGNIYLNIHTTTYSAGEIRGQLNMSKGFVYESWINGAQEVPQSRSTAMGLAVFELNYSMDSFDYDVVTTGLSNVITGIHLHDGAPGKSGGVALNLSTGISGKVAVGTILEADLNTSVLASLNTGDLYVNVHSLAFPGGEIRGQVYRMSRDGYAFNLCGEQQEMNNNSKAYGTAILAIDKDASFMHMMMVNSNLSEEITAAHIHEGKVGTSGNVLFGLTLSGNNYFAYDDTSGMLDTSVFRVIKEGNAYVNVHTMTNPMGETRGQIDNETECPSAPVSAGLNNTPSLTGVSIFPNPANDFVQIQLNTNETTLSRLHSLTGEVLQTTKFQGDAEIDIRNLKAGVYIVELSNTYGSYSQRLIKY